MEKHSFNEWWKGKIYLAYCPTSYNISQKGEPGKMVNWEDIEEVDIIKIKEKQKELFETQTNALLKSWKKVFSNRIRYSEMKNKLLSDEIYDLEWLLFGFNPFQELSFRNRETNPELFDLAGIQKYVDDILKIGKARQYDFVHSPQFKFKGKYNPPTEIYAEASWSYNKWILDLKGKYDTSLTEITEGENSFFDEGYNSSDLKNDIQEDIEKNYAQLLYRFLSGNPFGNELFFAELSIKKIEKYLETEKLDLDFLSLNYENPVEKNEDSVDEYLVAIANNEGAKNDFWFFEEYRKYLNEKIDKIKSKNNKLKEDINNTITGVNNTNNIKKEEEVFGSISGVKKMQPKPKPEFTLPQLALKLFYQGDPVDRINGNDVALEFGHNSGEKLFQLYSKYSSRQNRIGVESTKRKNKNKLKLFEKIIPTLLNGIERATDEMNTLKVAIEAEYQ